MKTHIDISEYASCGDLACSRDVSLLAHAFGVPRNFAVGVSFLIRNSFEPGADMVDGLGGIMDRASRLIKAFRPSKQQTRGFQAAYFSHRINGKMRRIRIIWVGGERPFFALTFPNELQCFEFDPANN